MSNKLSLMVNFLGIDKMSGTLRNITKLGKKGTRSLGELRGATRKLESQMRGVRKEMSGAAGNVTALIDRERQLERAIDRTNREMVERKRLNAIEGNRRGMRARGDKLMASGREDIVQGASLAAPLILATKKAAEFSSGMVDIQQKAGLTNAATDQLGRNILVMAKNAKTLPEDMRAGLDLLLSKGMSLDIAQEAIGPAGRLATAYKVDIPDAANAAFSSINNLKVPAAQTARILDMMAAAGNEGAFEVRNMARHFPALTAQMQALGEKGAPAVADLSAALQVAMNTAGSEDEAGNNIKNVLAKINAPATIRAFKKNFGVDLPAAMKKFTDEGMSSMEAIAMVTKQATGGDMKKLGFAFEDMQARQGVMALIQNLEEYRRIRAAAMNSGGTVDKAFGQRAARDATVNWKAFMGSASALAITLGATLLPVATDAMDMISGLANSVSAWAQANPEAAATLTKVVAGLAVFKIGLGAGKLAFGGFLKPAANFHAFIMKMGGYSKIFTGVRTAMLFMGKGAMKAGLMMMANPMILAITLLVAAIAGAAYLIYTNWDKIKEVFWKGVEFLTGLRSRMITIGKQLIMGIANGIRSQASQVWNSLKSIVTGAIDGAKNLLGIKSPSRVFMAIGAHTGEGMARGIDGKARRVAGAAGKMARGAVAAGAMAMAAPAAAQPASGAQTGGGAPVINVTFKLQQREGESEEAFAERILRKLEALYDAKARRSYGDDL